MLNQSSFPALATGLPPGRRSLEDLTAALPELYQPLFRHQELSTRARRPCDDRLASIAGVCQTLRATLQRPVRVLDLGCAQGYFSLALAAGGAIVEGVDFQAPNIDVCQALAAEHPESRINFRIARIEDVVARLEPDRYDLVLGLSVFHHLVRQHGLAAVQRMLGSVAETIGVGVFELALASEPLDWAASQPGDPRQLLTHFAFVHETAQSGTHLSSVTRPLFAASNRYWILDGHMGRFDTWMDESHSLSKGASGGTRRYFFGDGNIVKQYWLDNEAHREPNIREHDNEVAFLRTPPNGLQVPQLYLHNRHDSEAWMVRQQLPGELLSDRILAAKPYDGHVVLRDVLQQLVLMESAGLYHNDLRTWNVLVEPNGRATLIDYGSISADRNDCAWPRNLFLAFMIFTHEVLHCDVSEADPLRPPALNPDMFPEPYRLAFWDLLERNLDDWSFAFLHERLFQTSRHGPNSGNAGLAIMMRAMDEAVEIYRDSTERWRQLAILSATAIRRSRIAPG